LPFPLISPINGVVDLTAFVHLSDSAFVHPTSFDREGLSREGLSCVGLSCVGLFGGKLFGGKLFGGKLFGRMHLDYLELFDDTQLFGDTQLFDAGFLDLLVHGRQLGQLQRAGRGSRVIAFRLAGLAPQAKRGVRARALAIGPAATARRARAQRPWSLGPTGAGKVAWVRGSPDVPVNLACKLSRGPPSVANRREGSAARQLLSSSFSLWASTRSISAV
jgi:hypothetical protein